MTKVDEAFELIQSMTVLEARDLVRKIEEEFGVSAAAAPVAVAAAAGSDSGSEEEEQTAFNVVLKDFGANKINVIKVVRELTTLGLKEAKEFVESAPSTVKEEVTKEEAEQVKAKLEGAGAAAEIQ